MATVTIQEAAQYLNRALSTVQEYCRGNQLKSIGKGKNRRIPVEALEAMKHKLDIQDQRLDEWRENFAALQVQRESVITLTAHITLALDQFAEQIAQQYLSILPDLPKIPIKSESFYKKIPTGVTGVYFIEKNENILYIGKARDARQRWRVDGEVRHHILDLALNERGCVFSWIETPARFAGAVEAICISELKPIWNCTSY